MSRNSSHFLDFSECYTRIEVLLQMGERVKGKRIQVLEWNLSCLD